MNAGGMPAGLTLYTDFFKLGIAFLLNSSR